MKNKLHVEVPETPELFRFRLFRPGVELLIKGLESLYKNEIHGKMISGQNISREEESKLQQLEEDVMSLKKFLEEGIDKQTLKSKKMKLWIARDKDGSLRLWKYKPKRDGNRFIHGFITGDLDMYLYPEITFENSPQEIELKRIADETND